MKLSVRMAGLCASATFILTALPGFYQQAKPTHLAQIATDILPGMNIIEKMLISLGGAVCTGVLGYVIGDILSNPKGQKKKRKPKTENPSPQVAVASVVAQTPSAETQQEDNGVVSSVEAASVSGMEAMADD